MTAHPLERPALLNARRILAGGQTAASEAVLREALAQEPNLPRVSLALARLRWPGPDYRYWLAWLHQTLQPACYLEIGVEKGGSLALAQLTTRVIGVDPSPVGDPLAGCASTARLYRQTSGEFLASPPHDSGLRDNGFNLAFVDGDHRFEGVLDDFIGLQAWAAPGALVVMHDTLPLSELTATQERQTGFYSGDGYKLVPCLHALLPKLRIVTLPIAPTGLTLITGLDPQSRVLTHKRQDILDSYARLNPARVVERPGLVMGPLGRNDRAWVQAWLRDAGVQSRS